MKKFTEWLSEGEQLYTVTMEEFKSIEAQIDDLQNQLASKKVEVNQIASIIGKPTVEASGKKLTAEIVEGSTVSIPASRAIPLGRLTRALTGRGPIA